MTDESSKVGYDYGLFLLLVLLPLFQTRLRQAASLYLPDPVFKSIQNVDQQLEPYVGPEATVSVILACFVVVALRFLSLRLNGRDRAIAVEGKLASSTLALHHSETTAVAVAGPPVGVALPSTPRSKDISNQVAAVFEGEVNAHLENYFQSVLPKCEFSKFKRREIDDDNATLEMDSFSYMTKDTLDPPKTDHGAGIYVVRPNGITKKKPKGAPRKLGNSPGAVAANLVRTAEKYVVGESYSGDREERIKKKVDELEAKLRKMKNLHSSQSDAVSDVTSLFGAAILSFTCQSLPRKDQSKKCMKAVLEELSSSKTPILWRLAQAERLFIVVLSTSEGPTTCAFREISRGIQTVEIGLQTVEIGLMDLHSMQTTTLEKLDEIQKERGKEVQRKSLLNNTITKHGIW